MSNKLLISINLRNTKVYELLSSAIAIYKTSPALSVVECRKVIELLVKENDGNGLHEKIFNSESDTPDIIRTKMHYVRKLGNNGAHSSTPMDIETAKQCISNTLSIVKWKYKIPEADPQLRFRYFIADAVHRTWAKIAVLSSDGILYSEYLYFNILRRVSKSDIDFSNFRHTDHSFGAEEHGHAYQPMREVSFNEACQFTLTRQVNWVAAYVAKKQGQ